MECIGRKHSEYVYKVGSGDIGGEIKSRFRVVNIKILWTCRLVSKEMALLAIHYRIA